MEAKNQKNDTYSSVTYIAIYGGTQPTTWTEKLTQEYYDSVAKKLSNSR